MRTIETTARVTPDGLLTVKVQAPSSLGPGNHRAVVVVDDAGFQSATRASRSLLDLKVFRVPGWSQGSTFRREDIYGDSGR